MKKRRTDSERSRPRLGKETVRVLVDGDLEQVHGAGQDAVRHLCAKNLTRYCPTGPGGT